MADFATECALCGQPVPDLCTGCGAPFGADHGWTACPRCGRRTDRRARSIAEAAPNGRALGLVLIVLAAGAAGVIWAQLAAR